LGKGLTTPHRKNSTSYKTVDKEKVLGRSFGTMHLAQDSDKWQALVNTDINFGAHKTQEIYWLAKEITAS
jgi:hypothetical protein